MKRQITIPLLAVLGLAMTTAHGAIVMVDNMFTTSTVDGLSYTIDGSALDFTGASKLVVTVGSEGNSSNGASPAAISSLTYGGVALGAAVTPSGTRSNVWYVDLAGMSPVGTNFQLEFVTGGETNRGYGFSAYTLSGTAAGVSASGSATGTTTSITTPTANEFLIASFSRNSSGQNPSYGTSGLTTLNSARLEGQYTAASIYGTLPSAGTQDVEILGMNNSGETVIATFAAAAIPEPTSATLLGMMGALILLRRRRIAH